MEQNQLQKQQQTPPITQLSEVTPIQQNKPKSSYATRLFSGRINRQNYIIGSTLLSLPPMICFLIVIFNILHSPALLALPYLNNPSNPTAVVIPHVSITALLQMPQNELWSAIGVLFFIISIPYLLSLQIRRLHDLNLNGWLWTINIMPLISFYSYLPGMNTHGNLSLFFVINFISLITSLFPFYVTLWQGTKGPNKYGEKPLPRISLLKDILAVT